MISNVPQISVDGLVYFKELTENGGGWKRRPGHKFVPSMDYVQQKYSNPSEFLLEGFC